MSCIGTGHSNRMDARRAARQACEQALAALGGAAADLVLVFATVGYPQGDLLDEVRAVCGDAEIVGCSAEGVIGRAGSDESMHAVNVLALQSERVRAATFVAQHLSADAARCGRELAEAMAASPGWSDARLIILFPDGLTGNATALVRALEEHLPTPVPMVGGTAGENHAYSTTYQYRGNTAYSDAVTAVLLSGAVQAEIAVSHGGEAFGIEREVTESDGICVKTIDGQPTWSLFAEYLGDDAEELPMVDITYLCLGQSIPEAAGHGAGESLLIRTPMHRDRETGAMFFPGGLPAGATVRLVRRDRERILASVTECGSALAARRPEQQPLAVLQFDCASRGGVAFGAAVSETVVFPLQAAFAATVPWIGFHTYGEIAPMGGRPYLHNVTAVVCALYETP